MILKALQQATKRYCETSRLPYNENLEKFLKDINTLSKNILPAQLYDVLKEYPDIFE